uniref:MULE transposase domain-containing protein n=1 Tax=Lactuca sativa TaxID=4236 RepID=A0A9R1X9E9_LACSA|nr:hypothetical protein LSAT_V11C600312110 [Lactuca sativa]
MFCMLLNHGGKFTDFPGRKYVNGKRHYVELIDIETFSVHDIDDMMVKLGYIDENLHVEMYYHFRRPLCDLDFGLFALASDDDVRHLAKYVGQHKLIEVYTEHGQTKLHTYSMSPNPSKVRIVEIDCTPKRLFLEWHDTQVEPNDVLTFEPNRNNPHVSPTRNEPSIDKVDMVSDNANIMETEIEHSSDDNSIGDEINSGDDSESQDGDFLLDEDNIIDDVEVDMREFHLNVDPDVEWIGGASKRKNHVVIEDGNEADLEVIDMELFLSDSSSDDGIEGERNKKIKAIRRAHENENAQVRGTITSLGGGTGQEVVNEEGKCPWVLLASKWKRDNDWTVKTYVSEHKCLQTRKVRACDYNFLSKQILQLVEANPKIPVKALREQLQRIYKVDISKMKAFRAREADLKIIRGDYATQYKILQDYLLEVQTQNPDTTIKLDVESEPNPDVETRTFRRVYVCLGALKQGFAAGKRDFLGVDGAFMKGPFHGQILFAVALDGNNGIYPLAYVVVEAETLNSWTWFLTHLGDDLGLASNSNFTFISDRQKGLSSAIADLFPCAEHRYCVRHIHENMRSRWRGDKFKELLWNCSTTYTVQEFEKEMEEVRKLNQEWRAHSDIVINNICECFNSKIIDGRDTPIINCLEFIREYIMKRIVNVEKEIDKATGPLTPTATKLLQKIKDQAEEYTTSFCGNGKYQVSGP